MAERDASERIDHAGFNPQPMVDWYSPYQLVTTGLQVLVWENIGQGRAMEEVARSSAPLAFGGDELWFDFVADVGDGWRSTFAIASLIARPALEVAGEVLPGGAFLVFGGDEVYPVPSHQNYQDRFVGPYRAAFPAERSSGGEEDQRVMVAIPGNHDWYDGLVAFTREFTHQRPIGSWRTVQSQTYFALKLPQRWWLWGLDVLPGSRMDYGQREYFRLMAEQLMEGDRVILVAADPDWVQRDLQGVEDSHFTAVEREFIAPRKATVHLWLAGDLHHYRRHERRMPDGSTNKHFQRITSGGGGAYLSSTHRPGKRTVVVDDIEFVRKAAYPTAVTSFRLSLLNLLFAFKNWKLGIFPLGTLYWTLTWAKLPEDWPAPSSWLEILRFPGVLLWLIVILAGFVIFADSKRWWFRWFGGLAHGFAHVLTATLITGYVNTRFLESGLGIGDLLAASALNFLAGAVVGTTVLGIYLMLALNLFGFEMNGAFSSIRIEDYKHFLRLHITPAGVLRIFPIAIRRVPRRHAGQGRYTLIEGPLLIDPRSTSAVKPAY